jgi:exopolysaccharide biosynthesis polyprenyl glycosylphosphotransferase
MRGSPRAEPGSPALTIRARESRAHVGAAAPAGHAGRESTDARLLEWDDYRELLGSGAASPSDVARRYGLALADVIALGSAFAASGFASAGTHIAYPVLVLLPLWVMMNKLLGLYDRDGTVIDKSTLHEIPRLAESVAVAGGLVFLAAPLVGAVALRHQALVFFVVALALLVCLRWVVRQAVLRVNGPERAVIVGSGSVAWVLTQKLRTHPRYGVNVVGYIDASSEHPFEGDVPLLGDLRSFAKICRELRVQRVVVAFAALDHEHLLDTVRASNALGLKLTIVPRLFEVLGRSMVVDEVQGMSLLSLRGVTPTRSSLVAKRAIDVLGSAVALVLLAPLMLVAALAIKLTSRGPILFSQPRIGRDQRSFRMLKFRTMVDGAEELKQELSHLNEAQYPMFKIAADPRITPVGRVLRRTSLDELPQLWNVLRGQMSLVGPRPLVPAEDAHVIGWHRARLHLAPGLTGPWQVMGRTEIPFQEMIKLDYRYMADWSIWNDLKLLLQTVPVVLRREGL